MERLSIGSDMRTAG